MCDRERRNRPCDPRALLLNCVLSCPRAVHPGREPRSADAGVLANHRCKTIAETYRNRRRPEEALSWGEQELEIARSVSRRPFGDQKVLKTKRVLLARLGRPRDALARRLGEQMKRYQATSGIPTLTTALSEYMNVDELKKLARLTSSRVPTRKAELVEHIVRHLEGHRLRKVWQDMDELQRAIRTCVEQTGPQAPEVALASSESAQTGK